MIDLCYAKAALTYREQMAGNSAATELPPPAGSTGTEQWDKVVQYLGESGGRIQDAVKRAEGAHKGRAAEAAQASFHQVTERIDASKQTAEGVKNAIVQQEADQRDAFRQLPSEGGKLQTGSPVQMHPPEKDWVDHTFGSWTPLGDYEERQRYFQETNAEADQVMQQYQNKTETRIQALPKFEPPKPPPPPPPPPPATDQGTAAQSLGNSTYGSTPNMGSGSGSSTPSSTSSAWSSGSGGGGSYTPSTSTPAGQGPAGTGSAWAQGGSNSSLPPGMVKGPDGTVYRQLPDGSWQRQNPYNGRWAPAPQGPPGAGGGRGGAGGAAGGGRGGAGGAAGGARGSGGFGPQGSSPLGQGGRSGVAPTSGAPSNAAPSTGAAGGGQSGRGGAMRPMGGGQQGGQGGEEEDHERPSWLVETEDVWTNDMDKTAPPVIGLAPWEKEG